MFHGNANHGWRRAVTLIELLVVIAIIGILLAILLAAVQSTRESARRTQCASQLQQIVLAMSNYESAHRRFPPGFELPQMTMWSGFLLPYIEQNNLFETIDLQAPWVAVDPLNPPPNVQALNQFIALLQCPSAILPESQLDGFTNSYRVPCSYLACASGTNNRESGAYPWCGMNTWTDPGSGTVYPASDGVFYLNSRTRTAEIVDGLSHTMLVGESIPNQDLFGTDYSGNIQKVDHWYIGSGELFDYPQFAVFGSAENSECLGSTACPLNAIKIPSAPFNDLELSFGSFHANGVNLGFADGHVRFVSESLDPAVRAAIGSRAGRETDHAVD